VRHQGLHHLARQAFLDLQPPREAIDQPGQLGEADHALAGQVGHVCVADEGQHVVLAGGLERDVLEQDQLVVPVHVAERGAQDLRGVLVVAGEQLRPALDHARRGVLQALAVRVVADGPQDRAQRLLGVRLGGRHDGQDAAGVVGQGQGAGGHGQFLSLDWLRN
jgi:hypothetical protein